MKFLGANHKIEMWDFFQQLRPARLRHAAEEPKHCFRPAFRHAAEHSHFAERQVNLPFDAPSDSIVGGTMFGRTVYFFPRHGQGHRILPHELNHRANIYALRSVNVRWIICVTAVGSLQEKYAPRDVLLPSQFFDRTSLRACHTFFGEGIAAHVSFVDPNSPNLRQLLAETARKY